MSKLTVDLLHVTTISCMGFEWFLTLKFNDNKVFNWYTELTIGQYTISISGLPR